MDTEGNNEIVDWRIGNCEAYVTSKTNELCELFATGEILHILTNRVDSL